MFCELFCVLTCSQRFAGEHHTEQQQYVKKPLNAYMLYLKEQRSNVKAEIRSKGGSAVNAFLGAQVSVTFETLFHLFVLKYWQEKYLTTSCETFRCLRFTVLRPQWKTLTKQQKAKYFQEAEQQRLLHKRLNPGWSTKDNYVSSPGAEEEPGSADTSVRSIRTQILLINCF